MADTSATAAVAIGLAAGVAFIVLFAIIFTSTTPIIDPYVYRFVVVIPKGTSNSDSGKTFTPQEASIGWGTTVRWVNQDSVPARIEADDNSDPEFYNATKDFVIIAPGDRFEFTFTRAGTFGYHGAPWQRGTVAVCYC